MQALPTQEQQDASKAVHHVLFIHGRRELRREWLAKSPPSPQALFLLPPSIFWCSRAIDIPDYKRNMAETGEIVAKGAQQVSKAVRTGNRKTTPVKKKSKPWAPTPTVCPVDFRT
jgi:hypothetical protein